MKKFLSMMMALVNKTKNIISILVAVSIFIITFSGCNENTKSNIDSNNISTTSIEKSNINSVVEKQLNKFFLSLKSHDVKHLSNIVSPDIAKGYNENYEQFINTIIDCNLISVKEVKTEGKSKVKALVNYTITYSDDYIPTGVFDKGKNNITEVFEFKKTDDNYIIIKKTPDLSVF